ncbi:MAG: hypothetical protein EZS28_035984, partial [Streblomastix strix]
RPRLYGLAGKILPLIDTDRFMSLRRLADLLGNSPDAIAASRNLIYFLRQAKRNHYRGLVTGDET